MNSAIKQSRVVAVATASAVVIASLAACASTRGPASGSRSAGMGTTGGTGSSGLAVTRSRLYYLTKLSGRQLCGLLHRGEPAQITGGPTSPGTFAIATGASISCTWLDTSRSDELSIVISKVEDWQETRTTDKLVSHWARTEIDGHAAIYFGTHLDVAAAGSGDPAVTFDSKKLAESIRLARVMMPRLLAISNAA